MDVSLKDSISHLSRYFLAAAIATLAGCGSIHWWTSSNQPSAQARPTRASGEITQADLGEDKVFIGIAMSGGGSRAANFAAAALLELEALGILQRATAISAVSGSTLAASYYALHGERRGGVNGADRARDDAFWNQAQLQRRLGRDIQNEWLERWMYPTNILRYWFTDFDRSDIMKAVLEDVLFDGNERRFADLGRGTPRLFLNATRISGEPFVFTDATLHKLHSDLFSLPLSEAIMSSAAFPGVFQNVTLTDYGPHKQDEPQRHVHLFDGGPSDNLGLQALFDSLHGLLTHPDTKELRGCLFVLVDSYVNDGPKRDTDQGMRSDTRRFFDFLFDDNSSDAFDALLTRRRQDTLWAAGYRRADAVGKVPVWEFQPFTGVDGRAAIKQRCHFWHITFDRLKHLADEKHDDLVTTLNTIKTRFKLEGDAGQLLSAEAAARDGNRKSPCTLLEAPQPFNVDARRDHIVTYDPDDDARREARALQCELFRAAKLLVQQDTQARLSIAEKLNAWYRRDAPAQLTRQ
jgi:predicted acylesterase/phospholipase RssA